MRVSARDPDSVERRVRDLEFLVRRSLGLHGLYAAAGLLIGLFLPVAQLAHNDEVPDSYTAFGLIFSVHADYLLDQPAVTVIAGLLIAVTALVAIVAFLAAARGQNPKAATVAQVACSVLTPVVFLANVGLGFVMSDSGSEDDPVQGWQAGSWVLLFGGLGCVWIATVLRDHLER